MDVVEIGDLKYVNRFYVFEIFSSPVEAVSEWQLRVCYKAMQLNYPYTKYDTTNIKKN